MVHCVYSPYTMGLHFPPSKLSLCMGRIWTPSNTVPWSTQVNIPKCITISSAVFAGVTVIKTNRQTTLLRLAVAGI